jgi:transposase
MAGVPVLEAGMVVAGVDTHRDTHTVVVLDSAGRQLGTAVFGADGAGYAAMLAWVVSFGPVARFGVEGTGSYGAGLARHLTAAGVEVVEVDRPDRRARRRVGKSDPLDALAAARAVLAGTATGQPKAGDGRVEALRNLRIARRSAVEDRSDLVRLIKSTLVTAPGPVRQALAGLATTALVSACFRLRPDPARAGEPEHAVKITLRSLARRHATLTVEIDELDELIGPLVTAAAPAMLELVGVGIDVAGQMLVTAGDNPDRISSEGAFAMLTGVAPLPASSGKTNRHRLNRGGDRQANAAIYRAVITRMRHHQPTRDYVTRRTAEGLTKPEIIRCLKRLLAREIYYRLHKPGQPHQTGQPAAA